MSLIVRKGFESSNREQIIVIISLPSQSLFGPDAGTSRVLCIMLKCSIEHNT